MTTTALPEKNPEPDEDKLSVAEIFVQVRAVVAFAWRERTYVWRALAITMPIGALIAFGSTSEYTATTKLLPYRSASVSSSGLSGLAGLAGVRLPGSPADPQITADLYPDVVNTIDFRIAVAETPIFFSHLRKPTTPMYYFQHIKRRSPVDWLKDNTIRIPRRIANAIGITGPTDPTAAIAGVVPLPRYNQEYLNVLDDLSDRLTVDFNKKSGLITIAGRMPDAYGAAYFVQTVSQRLMERIIDTESKKAGEQLKFVAEEQRRAKKQFNEAQANLATFTDKNRGILSAQAQIEAQRLQNEYNLAFDLYRQFNTEYEQSRIKQNQDTPVFTILEQVVVPTIRTSPRRVLNLVASMLIGVALGIGYAYARAEGLSIKTAVG